MSIDLLLRALRKCCELPDSDDDRFAILIEDEWRVNQFLYEDRIRHLSILADKIHKRILVMSDKDWTKAFNYGRASVERCDL